MIGTEACHMRHPCFGTNTAGWDQMHYLTSKLHYLIFYGK